MARAPFIVIEGLDGSGKSTQAELLWRHLNEHQNKLVFGYRGVLLTREPTSGLIGGIIRSQLAGDWQSSQECLQLLFAADRAYHLEKEIMPLIEKGVVVICDRYFFSSFAYGNMEKKLAGWLREINRNFLVPDMTIVIDVPSRVCIDRIARDRFAVTMFEKEKELSRVRKNYLAFAKQFKNMHVIDGDRPSEEVAGDIAALVDGRMHAWRQT